MKTSSSPPFVSVRDDIYTHKNVFYLGFTASAANTDWFYYGAWAYTAP